MVLFGIPNCNTVKKAQEWLRANNIAFDFHDFKKKGVSAAQLEKWFDQFGWEKVLNKSGLTFKKLTQEEKDKISNSSAALQYLIQNTSAIKRPILVEGDKAILLGFNEQEYEQNLKH